MRVRLSGSRSYRSTLRDNPTFSTASEALIMQWIASHKYRLISGDIKTAFLSGDEDVRYILLPPPDDVRKILNVDHDTVLTLRKAVYMDW